MDWKSANNKDVNYSQIDRKVPHDSKSPEKLFWRYRQKYSTIYMARKGTRIGKIILEKNKME